ncbi:MAG: dual specificity protein phosphatase family protein [Planctomycetota bacterium]
MVEIHPKLYIGPQDDYENTVRFLDGWYVVHAAKEPYHREAVGYDGHDPPPNHPEYLVARRDHRLMLNLVDCVRAVDIPRRIFDRAVAFIHEGLTTGHQVLVHCQVAVSRSPAIGLLYLTAHTDALDATTYEEAAELYRDLYPNFAPGPAVRAFLERHWASYARLRARHPAHGGDAAP